MKPLSNLLHVKSNLKRILPTLITLGMEFAALTFMVSIGIGVLKAISYNMDSFTQAVVYVDPNKIISPEEFRAERDKIEKVDGAKGVYDIKFNNSTAMLPITHSSTPYIKVEMDKIDEVLKGYNVEVVEGELPKKDGEILITSLAAKALDVKVGDYIGKDYNDLYVDDGNYKVVGLIDGDVSVYVAPLRDEDRSNQLLILTDKGNEQSVRDNISEKISNILSVRVVDDIEDFMVNINAMLKRLGFIAISIFALVILITVTNLSKSIISNYSDEYSLLSAIGYKKKFINKRISAQLAVLIIGASIVGLLTGIFVNIGFNNLFCVPRGIPYKEFSIALILIPLGVGIILFFLSKILIIRKVNKMDFMGSGDL